ncbi:hypothetical protein O1R50_21325 [Glycomyces luteolus]|uniref:PE domain-containing protein n=1 Tax=Glycomyces luteolus TaxID=2670330 RepID=A0A9X3PBU7_9ACTN|nr:hypothetical protein [Glycomyces luteolus]
MPGLSIDPEGMDSAGQGLEGTSERFFAALEQFTAKIEGVGDACGGDEIGGLIGDAHQAVYEWAMECFQDLAQGIADAGYDVRDFAAQHLAVDDEIAQIFKGLESEFGGGS